MVNTLGRFRLVAWLFVFYLAVGTTLRLVLWFAFGSQAGLATPQLAIILPTGLLNDLIEATYLLAPLTLYTAILSDAQYSSRWNRRLLSIGLALTVLVFLYLGPVEYYFFEEFDSRFNIVATD